MTTRSVYLVAITALSLALIGCPALKQTPISGPGSDTSAPSGGSTLLAKLGIKDAKTLFLASSIASASTYRTQDVSNDGKTLFKVTKAGSVAVVEATAENGATSSVKANVLTSVGSDYVFLSVIGQGSFLARKSDGKAVQLESAPMPSDTARNDVQAYGSGGLVYNNNGALVRVKLPVAYTTQAAGDTVTKMVINDPGMEQVDSFVTDKDGNVLANMKVGDTYTLKLYKAGGGLQILPLSQNDEAVPLSAARDGSIYYVVQGSYGSNPPKPYGITHVSLESTGVATTSFLPLSNQLVGLGRGWKGPWAYTHINLADT